MGFIYLLEAVFIFFFIVKIQGTEENRFNESDKNNLTNMVKWIFPRHNFQNILENEYKDGETALKKHEGDIVQATKLLPVIMKGFQLPKYDWKISNGTISPVFMNFVINLNFLDVKKLKRRHRNKRRFRRELSEIENTGLTDKNLFYIGGKSENPISENFDNVLEKLKLRTALKREERNDVWRMTTNSSYGKDDIRDVFDEKLPKIQILNDKEIDVSNWFRNWKDILAVNPILSTDKPSKPDVEYIDEWKYAYRATLYNSGSYNVSNYVCSGILVASQWVLTSVLCNLGDNITIIIGVHTLPKNISSHNRYTAQRKIYSLVENLELIQMDRPVEWSFEAADIRALGMEEINSLLKSGKCSVLSWVPVEIENEVFELREYPQLKLQHGDDNTRQQISTNSVNVAPLQNYGLCRRDLGSPVLCDGIVTGILLSAGLDCRSNITVELMCPILEWVTFFTKENSYFEVTARKLPPNNFSEKLLSNVIYTELICILLVYIFMN